MPKYFCLLVGAAVLALPGCSAIAQEFVPPPVTAEFAADGRPVPFELFRGNRIFFTGTVNGQPAQIMLDSGAAMTVVDASFAAKAGVEGGSAVDVRGMGGGAQGRIVHDVKIAVGPLSLPRSQVLVMDFAGISTAIGKRIDLVLGRDAFDAGIVDVDFERHEIRFLPAAGFAPGKGAVKVLLTRSGGIRRIPVTIGDHAPILADFDLGHGGSFMLARADWANDAQLSALPFARSQAGGVGGLSSRRQVTLPSVTVAGQKFEHVPAGLNDVATDLPVSGANIGIDMLQRFRVTLDYAHDTLYLTPVAKAFARPLPKDRLGMRLELTGDRLKVVYVSPDGPAAKAGWKVGDLIASVNETAAGPGFYQSRYASFSRLDAGTKLDLVRADGVHQPVVLADYF